MLRLVAAALLVAIATLSPVGRALADRQESQDGNYPVIGRLELREYRVAILAAADMRLYSVADASGAVLGRNLTAEQFANRYPQLFERLQPAIAARSADLIMLAPIRN